MSKKFILIVISSLVLSGCTGANEKEKNVNHTQDTSSKEEVKKISLEEEIEILNKREYELFKNGKWSELIDNSDKIIEKDSENKKTYIYKSFAYLNMKQIEQAKEALSELEQESDNLIIINYLKGQLLDNTEDEKINYYRVLLQEEPNTFEDYIFQGLASLEMELKDKAGIIFDKALNIDEKSAFLNERKGYLNQKEGNYETAINYFNRAIQLNGEYVDAHLGAGNAYYKNEDYSYAVQRYESAIELTKNKKDKILLFKLKGDALRADKSYERAEEAYQEVLLIDIDNASAYGGLAQIRYEAGNYSEAIPYIKEYTKAYPKDSHMNFIAGNCYFITQGTTIEGCTKAIEYYSKAIDSDSTQSKYYYNRALIYRLMNKSNELESDIEMAAQTDPSKSTLDIRILLVDYPNEIIK